MEAQEIASLVEFSEARAYRNLVQAAPSAILEALGFKLSAFGSAVAIVSPSVTNTLNVNRVIGLGVNEPASEVMVDGIADLYGQYDLSYGIEVGPCAQPRELVDWLRKRRLRRSVPTAVHFRRAGQIQTDRGAVSVIRACGAERELVADICCSVFRMPTPVRTLVAHASHIAGWRHWLAYLESRPVAAALSFVSDGAAWLGWDATLPEHRGLRAQSALIAHRVNDAAVSGCSYVTTETPVSTAARPDPSYRNYEKMGFVLAYERATYVALRNAGSRPKDGK